MARRRGDPAMRHRTPVKFSRLAAGVILLAQFFAGRAPAQDFETPDSLFLHRPAVTNDRAAGIGKRVKPGGSLLLADLRGPGIIRHIWMTNIRAVEPVIAAGQVTIEFHWDDRAGPGLVIPLKEFFGHRFTQDEERAFHMDLGKNAYYPMPFAKSARIEIRNHSATELVGVYWQIDYEKVDRLAGRWAGFNGDSQVPAPPPLAGSARPMTPVEDTRQLPAAGRLELARLKGPAVIRRIALTCDPEPGADEVVINRGTVMRMYWDDERQPSIEVPLADFFGVGFGARRDFNSVAWTQAGRHGEIRFPMPFKRGAQIELVNLAGRDAGRFTWRIDYERRGADLETADVEYLHACFRMSRPVPLNSTHVAMETSGAGKFVALIWSCHWLNAEQKPEGTQNFWVDGAHIVATGSEDYFGRAWGFGSAPEVHGYKGINLGPEPSASAAVPAEWRRVTAYRAHVLDPIHFQKTLKLDLTCYGYNRGHRTDEYTTVCFWYQREPHTPFVPLPALEDLLPLDHADSLGFGLYQIQRREAGHDAAGARRMTERLIERYPGNPRVGVLKFKRACLLEELGRKAEALQVYRKIWQAEPTTELGHDAADKIWLLEQPGRMLLKAAAPSRAKIYLDGKEVILPEKMFERVPSWGQPEIYRFTYPPMKVAWRDPSSAVMRLPTVRLDAGPGRHVIAVKASAAPGEPIFTPRVGYFFATLDLAGPDIVTDASWKISEAEEKDWPAAGHDDQHWKSATSHPLSACGDGAWTWLWPRGFANFPGNMERIWGAAIFPEDKAFKSTVFFRRQFIIP